MFSARKKIAKEKGADPDSFEESVAQVFSTLYQYVPGIKDLVRLGDERGAKKNRCLA